MAKIRAIGISLADYRDFLTGTERLLRLADAMQTRRKSFLPFVDPVMHRTWVGGLAG